MPRKKRYSLMIYGYDRADMLLPMTISLKEFKRQMSFFKKEVAEGSAKEELDANIEESVIHLEYERFKRTIYSYQLTSTDVQIMVDEANPGYVFR